MPVVLLFFLILFSVAAQAETLAATDTENSPAPRYSMDANLTLGEGVGGGFALNRQRGEQLYRLSWNSLSHADNVGTFKYVLSSEAEEANLRITTFARGTDSKGAAHRYNRLLYGLSYLSAKNFAHLGDSYSIWGVSLELQSHGKIHNHLSAFWGGQFILSDQENLMLLNFGLRLDFFEN